MLVEVATNNKNRTLPEVRLAFHKNGGTMADQGSVAFQFSHKGVIRVNGAGDELELAAIDAGAEDIFEEAETGETVIHTDQKDLAKVRDSLKDKYEIADAELTYVPANIVEISDPETARKAINLMDALEELDDVAATHTNFELADSLNL